MSLTLALAVLAAPDFARACSCAAVTYPTVESCQGARRALAGTVGEYEWPLAYRADAEHSVEIHLEVDTVWRGAAPPELVVTATPLGGAGSCTIYPPPGLRFVVCDDQEGGAEPAFRTCNGPALGEEAEALAAALGAGARPSAPARTRWPWWLDRERLADSSTGLLLLAAPFAAALVGAGLGAILPRRRSTAGRPRSRRGIVILLAVVATLVIAARIALHRVLPLDRALFDAVTLGPAAVAGLLGLVLGVREARGERRGLRGLMVAFLGVAVALVAGYARLHAPVQPDDVVACSAARAREHLRGGPRPVDFVTPRGPEHDAWEERVPAACTDWGLAPMRADRHGAIGFPDGRGGTYWAHRRGLEPLVYAWELP
ncbi:MAG: hypothetical protein R3B09_33360 [Nannocystaceae bacterium]